MRRVSVTFVAVLTLAAVLTGCGSGGNPRTTTAGAAAANASSSDAASSTNREGADASAWADDDVNVGNFVVSLAHPVAWRSQLSLMGFHYSTINAFFADFAVKDFCKQSDPNSVQCLWADLGSFPEGATLVTVGTSEPPGGVAETASSDGSLTVIDGVQATLVEGDGQGCLGSGADHSRRYTVMRGPSALVIMYCWRGADPALSDAAEASISRTRLTTTPGDSGVTANESSSAS